jgi:hypothetical protein
LILVTPFADIKYSTEYSENIGIFSVFLRCLQMSEQADDIALRLCVRVFEVELEAK